LLHLLSRQQLLKQPAEAPIASAPSRMFGAAAPEPAASAAGTPDSVSEEVAFAN
jgi:hypothetical protein